MASDFEVFEGKSLSDLFKDIYDNTKTNKTQLEVLMKEVVGFIKDGDTAVQIIPMLKEYLEINVKNDDQLVKMAAIVQRMISSEAKASDGNEFGMPVMDKFKFLQDNFKLMQGYVGKTATFTYFERTKANSYRHPLFKCIRNYE